MEGFARGDLPGGEFMWADLLEDIVFLVPFLSVSGLFISLLELNDLLESLQVWKQSKISTKNITSTKKELMT